MLNDILRHHPQPLVLAATPKKGSAPELTSALVGAGYRLVTAHDESETLDIAHRDRPHAIVLDVAVAPPGYGLCRTLRAASLATPIVLITSGHPTRTDILEAVHAGAWELRGTPLDTEELVARLGAYIEPKLELDRVSEECLVDRVSGLYNHLGLAKRADELAALATRHGLALACMVFRPDPAQLPSRAISDRLALLFKSVGRASDAVGRTGRAEFAVFASASNSWAAGRMIRRLTDRAIRSGNGIDLRAGYSAASPAQKISSHTLLARARSALDAATA
jgi:ActR/RegA family two-component response regulator